jgi:HEPN domain-containing protein
MTTGINTVECLLFTFSFILSYLKTPHMQPSCKSSYSAINKLNTDEKTNPFLVLHQLFDFANVAGIKDLLWQWLKITVTGGYTKKYTSYNEREHIVLLYEHLEKLLEASHLIYLSRKKTIDEQLSRLENQKTGQTTPFFEREDNISNALKEQLQQLSTSIVDLVFPAFIFYLGSSTPKNLDEPTIENNLRHYVLVIMPSTATGSKSHYESLLANKLGTENVFPIVVFLEEANRQRRTGNPFFVNYCSEDKLLYSNQQYYLADAMVFPEDQQQEMLDDNFDNWYGKASSFLAGAEFYIKTKDYSFALFMLHQQAEFILSAVIGGISGYKEPTHNIDRLIDFCRLWSPDFAELFITNTDEEQKELDLLTKAYTHARYHHKFPVTATEAKHLFERGRLFMKKAIEITVKD